MSSRVEDQCVERQASALAFGNIEENIDECLAGKDPRLVAVVKKHINDMDADGDGRITSPELARYSANLIDEAMATKQKNRDLKRLAGGAAGLIFLLAGGVFGSSAAAAFLAKDTHVEVDSTLRTKSNELVNTGIAETTVTVAALAWLPDDVVSHLDTITFGGKDGGVYNRKISGSFVNPKKEAVITTFDGDTLAWTVEDKSNVLVTLRDGTSWTKHAACDQCTVTNVVTSDAIERALAEFRDAVGKGHVHEHGRLLQNEFEQNEFGQNEFGQNECAVAYYRVALPDGRTQTVTYYADGDDQGLFNQGGRH